MVNHVRVMSGTHQSIFLRRRILIRDAFNSKLHVTSLTGKFKTSPADFSLSEFNREITESTHTHTHTHDLFIAVRPGRNAKRTMS